MKRIHPNEAAINYWRRTGFTDQDVFDVCAELDNVAMAASVTFDGQGNTNVRLTQKTWDRQLGHYPSVADFFGDLRWHPRFEGLKGSFIVWLEDGLWEYWQKYSRRAPTFSFGRHVEDHQTLLLPDPAYFGTYGYRQDLTEIAEENAQIPWRDRSPTAFWRGAATGLGIETEDWVKTARGQLTLLAVKLANPEVLDAKITKTDHLTPEQQEVMKGAGVVDEPVGFLDFLKYKYTIDADGYCCAWRSLFLKLASGSVVLKIQSPYEQWYFRDLIAWKHYIPLKRDLSDFEDVYRWLISHDEEAEQIAKQAQDFVQEISFAASRESLVEDCIALLA